MWASIMKNLDIAIIIVNEYEGFFSYGDWYYITLFRYLMNKTSKNPSTG